MKVDIPYALVPDWNGYPANSPLHTFEGEISDDQMSVLAKELSKGGMEPDGFIINKHFPELYKEWKGKVKELHPDWKDYAGVEVYIPEECHMMAHMMSMFSHK